MSFYNYLDLAEDCLAPVGRWDEPECSQRCVSSTARTAVTHLAPAIRIYYGVAWLTRVTTFIVLASQ